MVTYEKVYQTGVRLPVAIRSRESLRWTKPSVTYAAQGHRMKGDTGRAIRYWGLTEFADWPAMAFGRWPVVFTSIGRSLPASSAKK